MQFCEDIEKHIKQYTRPYRDPKSHKNHKLVMAEIKFHFKVWSAYVSWQHVLWLESSEDSYLYDGLALFYLLYR